MIDCTGESLVNLGQSSIYDRYEWMFRAGSSSSSKNSWITERSFWVLCREKSLNVTSGNAILCPFFCLHHTLQTVYIVYILVQIKLNKLNSSLKCKLTRIDRHMAIACWGQGRNGCHHYVCSLYISIHSQLLSTEKWAKTENAILTIHCRYMSVSDSSQKTKTQQKLNLIWSFVWLLGSGDV